jgi:predicted ester cyclase
MLEIAMHAADGLLPAAYAPYRNPRDFILSWTDVIWIERALGRLSEHYAPDVKVHTAYGETYDFDHVILNSVQKMSAFPNGGGGSGEDVIWEERGSMGFISSHRVLKTGTNSGYWIYGAPTGRNWISRTIAHCVVQDGKVVEEWLVRDEFAVLEALGLDPEKIAAGLAAASPVTGGSVAVSNDAGAFAGSYPRPAIEGVSGRRPERHEAECALIEGYYEEVWNGRRFDRAEAYCDGRIVSHGVRFKRAQGLYPYVQEVIDLLAVFPDGKIELRDLVVCESEELGTRIAAIWVLHGTYSGVPLYGPSTGTPVKVLGATHFEVVGGKILREWRLYDEIAVLTQIVSARQSAQGV